MTVIDYDYEAPCTHRRTAPLGHTDGRLIGRMCWRCLEQLPAHFRGELDPPDDWSRQEQP